MTPAADHTSRMLWHDVPDAVQRAVADILGSAVVAAISQPGGFSPGSADRVVTAGGRRAFVKAASGAVNAETPGIHLREAAVHRLLPAPLPVPALLGVVEQQGWVAVVLDDVEGRHPNLPWTEGDRYAVLDALAQVSRVHLAPRAGLPALEDELAGLFGGWARLAGRSESNDPTRTPESDDLPTLAPRLADWLHPRRDAFIRASAAALHDVRGHRLVHLDVRADNILIRPNGEVVLLDWPWACRGAGWFDALALMINVRLYDEKADVEGIIRRHPVFEGMSDAAATRTLIGLAGFFLDRSMDPPAPGIPTLRRFQRDQAVATLEWLIERDA